MKTCDFCIRQNIYICNPNDHCGLCPLGQEEDCKQEENYAIDEERLDVIHVSE